VCTSRIVIVTKCVIVGGCIVVTNALSSQVRSVTGVLLSQFNLSQSVLLSLDALL